MSSKLLVQRGRQQKYHELTNTIQHTDEIIWSHQFSDVEQWAVFLATVVTACSFFAVCAVLWKQQTGRGLDIVLIKASALCFVIYRSSIAFKLTTSDSAEYVFLTTDSWHKLSNVFMLIEYCSLIIFLARIPQHLVGYFLAFGIIIIVTLQEKDSFSYQYALIPLIFNNLVLICSSVVYDKSGSFNPTMVLYGAIWYVVSCVGFLLTFSETLDYYFFFDDLFMVSTAFSMFYSWQSFRVAGENGQEPCDTMMLVDVPTVSYDYMHAMVGHVKQWRDDVVEYSLKKRESGFSITPPGIPLPTMVKGNKKKKQEDFELGVSVPIGRSSPLDGI